MKNDPSFEANFKEDPVKAIENLMDIDLPNDAINDIVTAVKAKIGLDESGILDYLNKKCGKENVDITKHSLFVYQSIIFCLPSGGKLFTLHIM